MDKNIKILVAGGDLRQLHLADYLSEFFTVKKYALDESSPVSLSFSRFDIIIFPLIVSLDGENLNAPFSDKACALKGFTECIKEGGIIFGGKFPKEASAFFTSRGFKVIEYYDREELVIKNCIPTAEGALQIAMEELPVTVRGLKTLVAGYGRVGKVTSLLFDSVGADVTACARKESDLALCKALGVRCIKTADALENPGDYELIINTVPSLIIDKGVLERVKKSCLIIDLASRPGGVDFDAAKELGLKAIWALSLPWEVTKANPPKK